MTVAVLQPDKEQQQVEAAFPRRKAGSHTCSWKPGGRDLERVARWATTAAVAAEESTVHPSVEAPAGGFDGNNSWCRHGMATTLRLAKTILQGRDEEDSEKEPCQDNNHHVEAPESDDVCESKCAQGDVKQVQRREMGDSCPICFEAMSQDAVSLGCPCGAVFCGRCIRRLHSKGVTEIGRRRLCPLCRCRAVSIQPVKQDNQALLAKKYAALLLAAGVEKELSQRHILFVQAALVLVTLAFEAHGRATISGDNHKSGAALTTSNNMG